MTVFNIVHPTDLSRALTLISRMIDCGYSVSSRNGQDRSYSDPNDGDGNGRMAQIPSGAPLSSSSPSHDEDSNSHDEPVLLRSSFRNRPDLGLCVTLVRGNDCLAKYFNVTLVKNVMPPTPISSSLPQNKGMNMAAQFNPSLPSLPSMSPSSSATSGTTPSPGGKSGGPVAPKSSQADTSIPPPSTSMTNSAPPIGAKFSEPSPHITPVFNGSAAQALMVNNKSLPAPSPSITLPPTAGKVTSGVPSGLPVGVPVGDIPPQLIQLILLSQQHQQQQLQQQKQLQQQTHAPTMTNVPQPFFSLAQQQLQQRQPQQIQIPSQLPLNGVIHGVDTSSALFSIPVYPNNTNVTMNPIQVALQSRKAVAVPSPSPLVIGGAGNGGAGFPGPIVGQHSSSGPAYYASG